VVQYDKGFGFITPDDGDRDLFVHDIGIAGAHYVALAEKTGVDVERSRGPSKLRPAFPHAAAREGTEGALIGLWLIGPRLVPAVRLSQKRARQLIGGDD